MINKRLVDQDLQEVGIKQAAGLEVNTHGVERLQMM